MKILLNFKGTHIGTLSYDRKSFIYNSNLAGEKEVIEKFHTLNLYDLGNHVNFVSEKLFPFFLMFLDLASNQKYQKEALIFERDSEFMKLFKVASLRPEIRGFSLVVGY